MKSIFLKGDLKSVRRDDEGGWAEVNKKRGAGITRDDCPTNFSSAAPTIFERTSRVCLMKRRSGGVEGN